MSSILQVTGLNKSFGKQHVLRGVDLDLAEGETGVLLGSNGAGKSTLLRLVLGLDAPDRGQLQVLGLDPFEHERRVRELVGYVPDHPDVYGWMTAEELFKFLEPAYPTWSRERVERFAEALDFPRKTCFRAMSRGEAAKVLLAAALAPAPRLVVLDEAFARLSPPVREQVLEFFVHEAPPEGGAALIATHDLDVAARLADRVFVLEDGLLSEAHDLHALSGESVPARLRSLYSNSRCPNSRYSNSDGEALAG